MNTYMNAFSALVRKDLILYFSNKRALIITLAAPIAIAAFFGSLFGDGDKKPTRVPVAIVDLDKSTISKQVVVAMKGEGDTVALPSTTQDDVTLTLTGVLTEAPTIVTRRVVCP